MADDRDGQIRLRGLLEFLLPRCSELYYVPYEICLEDEKVRRWCRMGISSKAKIVPECSGCVKATRSGTCMVFTEPGWFWAKYGFCFGRSEDPEWQEKLLKASKEYAERKAAERGDARSLEEEVRKTA